MTRLFRSALVAFGALLASSFVLAHAGPAVEAPGVQVVALRMCVAGQTPEQVEATLTTPAEKLLLGLPGVETLDSTTGSDGAAFDVHFKGGATEDDVASVRRAVERSGLRFSSHAVLLGSPRKDALFFSRIGCEAERPEAHDRTGPAAMPGRRN